MALVLKDRVKETTTTTGTGTYTLAGAENGFEAFSSIGNSNTTYYCCTDGVDFEVGIGTYTLSGTTLARTTILQSSNSDAAVNWTDGTRIIFCTQPAEKAVFLDSSGNMPITNNATIGGTLGVTGVLTGSSLDISGDVDIDGTLEADAVTVNGTALNTVIAGVTVTNATNSAHVSVADNESTNEENLITFIEDASATGNVGLESDGDFSYNPSTGTVSATVFKGNIDAVDGDFDGTLEADAITVGGSALNTVIAGTTVTNATNAAHVSVADNENTNEENLIPFIEDTSATGNVGLESDGDFAYNPSTGTVSATIFKGNIDAVDGDFDGTLEADAITVGGTALNTVIAGVTVTNATNSAHVSVADNESTDEENLITFIEDASATGNVGLESDGDFSYNPSSGTVTATIFKGNIDAVDGDFDGTLEADAITVGGTALNTVIAGVTVTNATNSAHVLVTDNESTNEENLIAFVEDATSSTGNVGLEMDGHLTYNPSSGTVTATVFKGNIDAVDGDFDGTLEADAITLNGTAITATATLSTGISNNNVPKFTSGVADDDFLRVAGTAIEGRSASEVLSDIGATTADLAANEATALAIALG